MVCRAALSSVGGAAPVGVLIGALVTEWSRGVLAECGGSGVFVLLAETSDDLEICLASGPAAVKA